MNEGQEPREQQEQARHRWTETDHFLTSRLTQYPDEIRAEIADGAARHGLPFVAFISAEERPPLRPDVEAEFLESYIASYRSLREAIDAQIDALGWKTALSKFMTEAGIAEGDLTWNYAEIEVTFRAAYQVVEFGGAFHIFLT